MLANRVGHFPASTESKSKCSYVPLMRITNAKREVPNIERPALVLKYSVVELFADEVQKPY